MNIFTDTQKGVPDPCMENKVQKGPKRGHKIIFFKGLSSRNNVGKKKYKSVGIAFMSDELF
jgi:hypothetical protein